MPKYRIELGLTDADGGTWDEEHIVEASNDKAAETESEILAEGWLDGAENEADNATEVSVEIYALSDDGNEELVRDFQHGGILDASGSIYRDQCDYCTAIREHTATDTCPTSPDGHHHFNFGAVKVNS